MLFVYSGNFLVEAEKDQYDQTRIQMGLTDELFAYPLEAGAEFTAPEVILSYTNKGLSRLSQAVPSLHYESYLPGKIRPCKSSCPDQQLGSRIF